MDVFAKYETTVDASCKRNEKLHEDVCKELNKPSTLTFETFERDEKTGQKKRAQIEVAKYIAEFKWDLNNFPLDKSLKVLGAKVLSKQQTCDDRLKKLLDEQNNVKT